MPAAPAIRNVYVQLRQLLGDQVTSSDTLRFAAQVVQFCLKRAQRSKGLWKETGVLADGRPFETWPIDVAMEDGGWRILEYELDQFRPELELGRVHVYQTAARYTHRVYAAESFPVDSESERVLRSLDWLLGEKSTGAIRPQNEDDNYFEFDD